MPWISNQFFTSGRQGKNFTVVSDRGPRLLCGPTYAGSRRHLARLRSAPLGTVRWGGNARRRGWRSACALAPCAPGHPTLAASRSPWCSLAPACAPATSCPRCASGSGQAPGRNSRSVQPRGGCGGSAAARQRAAMEQRAPTPAHHVIWAAHWAGQPSLYTGRVGEAGLSGRSARRHAAGFTWREAARCGEQPIITDGKTRHAVRQPIVARSTRELNTGNMGRNTLHAGFPCTVCNEVK